MEIKSVEGVFAFLFTLVLLYCFVFSCSLIDRRGYVQPDTPQPAAPPNGMAAYGATQSQSDMVGAACSGATTPCKDFSFASIFTNPVTNQAHAEGFPSHH